MQDGLARETCSKGTDAICRGVGVKRIEQFFTDSVARSTVFKILNTDNAAFEMGMSHQSQPSPFAIRNAQRHGARTKK